MDTSRNGGRQSWLQRSTVILHVSDLRNPCILPCRGQTLEWNFSLLPYFCDISESKHWVFYVLKFWSCGLLFFFFSLYLLYGKKIFVLRICLPHSLLILSKHPLVLFDCSKNITNSKMLFFYINCYNWCKVSLRLGKRGKKIAAGKSKAWSEVGVDKIDLRREAVLSLWHC